MKESKTKESTLMHVDELEVSKEKRPSLTHVDELEILKEKESTLTHVDELEISKEKDPTFMHADELEVSKEKDPTFTHADELDVSKEKDPTFTHADELDVSKEKKQTLTRVFWWTIGVCFFATLLLAAVASWRLNHSSDLSDKLAVAKSERVLNSEIFKKVPIIGNMINVKAWSTPVTELNPKINKEIDLVFAPVYAKIPAFTETHYSVIGEYVEMGIAASGGLKAVRQKIEMQLFEGLDKRLADASKEVAASMNKLIEKRTKRLSAEVHKDGVSDQQFQKLLGNYMNTRIKVFASSKSITEHLAGSGVGATAGKSAAIISAKLLTKLAAKLAAKLPIKWVVTVVTGATVGTFLDPGPGTIIGTILGGLVGWFAVDAAEVSVDEWLHRADFERDLRLLITEQKEGMKREFKANIERVRVQHYLNAKMVSGKTPAEL